MDTNFAARILALPESVRAALATVEGPGWYVVPGERGPVWSPYGEMPYADRALHLGSAWWPANPARAVAVVTMYPVGKAHDLLYGQWCRGESDDHAAALSIIDAHVARAESTRQTVTNLGKVGEVVNLQGPVTLSIGADGVKVVR